ncbi:hypothetical protein [Candidatus Steffania adelgidicola]|uniref:hypothetical protein n=1 Tax=Candidatus Steffania adelgidicola TaxID=1076626 RepID=UPI001D032A63|nr:hypothetical protein [Candidatus Steffania adelgidicola]
MLDKYHFTIPEIYGVYHSNRTCKAIRVENGFFTLVLENRLIKLKCFVELSLPTIYMFAMAGLDEILMSG